jgi:hypothetical protein
MYLSETYEKKWQPVLEHADLPKITDSYKRAVTATILENQERASKEDRAFLNEAAPANATGSSVDNWDPILISLVRRAMPNLIAYDIAGVKLYLTKQIQIFQAEMLLEILLLTQVLLKLVQIQVY